MKEHSIYTGYLVTEDGRVFSAWSCRRNKKGQIESYVDYNNIKELKSWDSISGYKEVKIYFNKKSINKRVHRLVAETFIENPENLPQVNHIDENKQNNNVKNLEWVTSQKNTEHSCAKTYIIENIITGEKFTIFNLRKWCKEKNLLDSDLRKTLSSKRNHSKGYRIIEKRERE